MTDRRVVRAPLPLLWATASAAALGAATGVGLIYFPVLALGSLLAAGGVISAFVLVGVRRLIPASFLASLGILLAGYAFFGKSFAYLGVAPIFIGELMLLFAVVAALASGSLPVLMRSGVIWLMLAWVLWGAVRTVPFIAPYGTDALRDGALWGYSVFALAVAGCVLRTRSVFSVTSQYGRWVTRFAAWLPFALIMTRFADRVPGMPGTNMPLFTMKAGDGGVHLAGAAVFVLAGICGGSRDDTRGSPRHPYLFWALWLLGLVCVTSLNRGGFVAVAAALLIAGALAPVSVGRRVAVAATVAILAAGTLVAASVGLEDTSSRLEVLDEREISPRQVVENVLSIMGRDSARIDLTGTKEWRLDWWSTIIDYTIRGPYFWTGKGFGANLAVDDGISVAAEDDAPLRSPHNGHLTVLARMGIPGALLWVVLQLWFGWSLLRAYVRAQRAGAQRWAQLDLWILSYWLAFLINAAFDVSLEGPMAGIWFWCVFGFGVALIELQRAEVPRRGIGYDNLTASPITPLWSGLPATRDA